MHLIDIILISGAITCFSIAFLIASRPVKKRKERNSPEVMARRDSEGRKKEDVAHSQVYQVLHDETQ